MKPIRLMGAREYLRSFAEHADAWQCLHCHYVHVFESPEPMPSPCSKCGGARLEPTLRPE
jgi:hypothetical protein